MTTDTVMNPDHTITCKGQNCTAVLDPVARTVTLTHHGLLAGKAKRKASPWIIPLDTITDVEFKEPKGLSAGWIRFVLADRAGYTQRPTDDLSGFFAGTDDVVPFVEAVNAARATTPAASAATTKSRLRRWAGKASGSRTQTTMDVQARPEPGWSLDPAGSGRLRWWDGQRWTDNYHSPGTPATPVRTHGGSAKWKVGGGIAAAILLVAVIAAAAGTEDDTSTKTAAPQSTSTTSTTSEPTPTTFAATTPLDTAAATAAMTKLDTLAVKGRAPKTGYDRDQFGQAWSDDVTVASGHNGCDTRNDLLKSLDDIVIEPGTQDCVVLSGMLNDPYTARVIAFTRGSSTSSAVQIDHVVALEDAWQKGAQQLSADERRDFANDPRNLQPTDGPTNSQKGAGDAATWLPPNKAYRCTYVSRQIDVKAEYRLWVTAAEKSAMQRVLSACGATVPTTETTFEATTETSVDTEPGNEVPAVPTEPTTPAYVAPAPTTPDSSVYYKNCAAARAAGAAPVYRGQPGHGSHLDRDGDGVGCES